jgi:hypothetical protein
LDRPSDFVLRRGVFDPRFLAGRSPPTLSRPYREAATPCVREHVLKPLAGDLGMNVRMHEHERSCAPKGRARIVDTPEFDP